MQTDTILIIDDEAALRQSIRDYLEDSGFAVLEADNGEKGIEIFRTQKPDCVLTDLQMPKVKGLDVLETIREESPNTPILVISGQGVMQDAIQALRLGAWDYLLKPINDMAVLEHAVCRALERSRLIADNERYRREIEETNAKLSKTLKELEEDLTAGRRVQAQLSPDWQASIQDYQLSFNIEPSLYLSGDFVDYFDVPDKYLIFYVADVSGHGASSAFVTVLLKSLINQAADQYHTEDNPLILQPKAMLAHLSKQIHGAKLGKYLTIVYVVLNLETHEMCYSIGGHYPNPVVAIKDEVSFLPGKGFPVGIMAAATFEESTLTLPPGGRLVMYSDGILEIMPEEELEQKETALLQMVKNQGHSIAHLLDAAKVRDFEALPDDVTMLLIERRQA